MSSDYGETWSRMNYNDAYTASFTTTTDDPSVGNNEGKYRYKCLINDDCGNQVWSDVVWVIPAN